MTLRLDTATGLAISNMNIAIIIQRSNKIQRQKGCQVHMNHALECVVFHLSLIYILVFLGGIDLRC